MTTATHSNGHGRAPCACKLDRLEFPPRRVVLTGGPGAGKTAVLEVIKLHFCAHVAVLPEAATLVFSGGFPHRERDSSRRCAQIAIFHLQSQMEHAEVAAGDAVLLMCDRGVIDGLAYWPGTDDDYWAATGISRADAYARYDAVIHLRTPRVEHGYDQSNPARIESAEQAAAIDARIEDVWSGHPNRVFVPSTESFVDKVRDTLAALDPVVPSCCRAHIEAASR